ncbi:MAG TPA: hypothetical protein VHY76_10185 [Acetobacteraceae bacterium]|nr:hypothetical protein [Acetobacteraceae bacterium]
MPDIFDEIQEDLRAERMGKLARRYWLALVVAGVLVIAFAAGWQGWTWWQRKQTIAVAGRYLAAMQLADTPGTAGQPPDRAAAARAFMAVAAAAPDGYRTLARLRAAALQADMGHLPEALGLWDQVAGDHGADPLLRGLATLLWAQHQVGTGDPAAVKARLAPLAAPTDPWHGLAQETEALIDLRTGDKPAAKALLTQLAADTTAPAGVRGRARGLLTRLGG